MPLYPEFRQICRMVEETGGKVRKRAGSIKLSHIEKWDRNVSWDILCLARLSSKLRRRITGHNNISSR